MTVLMDLPDEILELVVNRLMDSLKLKNTIGSLATRYVHPFFPIRPFGLSDTVRLRGVCKRFHDLVDAALNKHISITLCSDFLTQNGKTVLDRTGPHPTCGSFGNPKHGPPGTNNPSWHILQSDSTHAATVRYIHFTLCYTELGYNDYTDPARITRVEAMFSKIMDQMGSTVQDIEMEMFQMYYEEDEGYPQSVLEHVGLRKPLHLPSLRSLTFNDASFCTYLPYLALDAPLLENVTLGWKTLREDIDFRSFFAARFGKARIRLPARGSWKSLTITAPEARNTALLLEQLEVVADNIVLSREGYEDGNLGWTESVASLAGRSLVGSDFKNLVSTSRWPESEKQNEARMQQRSALSAKIRGYWGEKKANVPIKWEGLGEGGSDLVF